MPERGENYVSEVKPLTDYNIILDFSDYLKEKNERDYVLYWTGIYTGRRISDILPLKVRDVKNKDRICFLESKTQKKADIIIHPELKKILQAYCADKNNYEYVFANNRKPPKPITRVRVWQILNEAAKNFCYEQKIGCHTLRKTFGYWLYQYSKDVVAIKELLNQSDISVTKRYIGIDQKQKDELLCHLPFGKM